ncbi:MmpS family transport accessory protein [Streptomyces sp. MS2A]|nr:MmpS family transport accessory protein [Streptomyces sp. MS2A]
MSAKDSAESAENTGSTERPEDSGSSANPETPEVTATGGGRAGVLIAAVLLLACAGLVGYGLLDTEDEPKPSATPAAAVTYEVTGDGTAEISYLGPDEDGRATVVRDAELPWKQTVQVPLGETPTVAVVLGEGGGQASCTLAIRGKHVQRATAMGEFGRATCTGELPAAGT